MPSQDIPAAPAGELDELYVPNCCKVRDTKKQSTTHINMLDIRLHFIDGFFRFTLPLSPP
jgi:hypothetical protein